MADDTGEMKTNSETAEVYFHLMLLGQFFGGALILLGETVLPHAGVALFPGWQALLPPSYAALLFLVVSKDVPTLPL